MNKLFTLFKYNILALINRFITIFSKKKNNVSTTLVFVLAGLFGILMYGFIILYMFLFGMLFSDGGRPEGIFFIAILAISMLSLMSGLTKANSYLFRMNDYDLLLSMPIKKSIIISSKITSLIFGNVGLSLLIGVPTMIIYSVFANVSSIYWLTGTIVFLVIPLLPLIVGSFISFLFGFIPINHKAKNILSTVLYIGLIIGIMMMYTTVENNPENITGQINDMINTLEKAYFLAPAIVLAISGVINYFTVFVACSLILTILFIAVVSFNFDRIKNILNTVKTKKVIKDLSADDYKKSTALKALIKKELIMYFNIPSYILNTIVGPIMSVVITIVFCNRLKDFTSGIIEGISFSENFFILMLVLMLIFSFTMITTSSSSISVEGKQFWIIKSAPVKCKDVFISKLFLNLLITIPFLIIDVIIAIFLIDAPFYMYIVMILIPFIFVYGTTVLGLYLNICYHKFDYDNIQKVIKSSMPVGLTVLFSFSIFIILFIVLVMSIFLFGEVIAIIIMMIIGVLYSVLFTYLLMTKGIKKYNEIEF